jgi:single-strand selective monofunctional uracil DNA glycosylase
LVDRLLAAWGANARRWEEVRKPAEAAGLCVFNPGLYAFENYARFLRRYPPRRGAILALGLNPGPAGMSQTGIPFTDCRTARGTLGLDLEIPGFAPPGLVPLLRRPDGRFRLTYERSSLVVYRFLERAWGSAGEAYANWFVGNPCPLLFLEPDGSNVTPADGRLRRIEEVREFRLEAVRDFARILAPRAIVALGNDVAAAVAEVAATAVPSDAFLAFGHPARAPSERWARELVAELSTRRLLHRAQTGSASFRS